MAWLWCVSCGMAPSFFIPMKLDSTSCPYLGRTNGIYSGWSVDLLPRLKKLKFKHKAIAKDDKLTAALEKVELGKPVVAYIREMVDKDRPTHYTAWKSLESLPESIKAKKNEGKLDMKDLQALMEYGPAVRKLFPRFFGGEGSLRRAVHHVLDYVQDGKFTKPALVLNSLNRNLIESFITRHWEQAEREESHPVSDPKPQLNSMPPLSTTMQLHVSFRSLSTG